MHMGQVYKTQRSSATSPRDSRLYRPWWSSLCTTIRRRFDSSSIADFCWRRTMTSSSSARTYARTLVILLPYVWIIYHNLNVLFSLSPYDTLGSSKHYEEQMLSTPWKDPYSSSSKKDDDSKLNERLSLLEDKLHAYLGYGGTGDPFLSTKISAPCKELSHLQDYCDSIPLGLNPDNCAPNVASPICLDDFPYNNCTVYDFGIRERTWRDWLIYCSIARKMNDGRSRCHHAFLLVFLLLANILGLVIASCSLFLLLVRGAFVMVLNEWFDTSHFYSATTDLYGSYSTCVP